MARAAIRSLAAFARGSLRRLLTPRLFLLLSCAGLAASAAGLWLGGRAPSGEQLVREALADAARDPRYAEVYRRADRLPRVVKYLLLWNAPDFAPFPYLGSGQRAFVANNCSVIDCYVTADKRFFGGDVTRFDAVAFNGRHIDKLTRARLPRARSPHQLYIYFNMESADNYPVCADHFDDFFNWTSTYRLDSDVPYPYVQIVDGGGRVVGPSAAMRWREAPDAADEDGPLDALLANKTKAAAWFVSNCGSRSGRRRLVSRLQEALAPYKLSVDVYGDCGPLKCPRHPPDACYGLLERDYLFYMSLENSLAEDYVTEKLLTAVRHLAVPVVLGGADYSRFLPPESYLDARRLSVRQLAAQMARLVRSPKEYRRYFRWRAQYAYRLPIYGDNVCAVCAALHAPAKATPTAYKHFRRWWNPDYEARCVS